MTYAGNSALASEVRERILSTFDQTLDLAAKGSVEEAKLGCDFILRMDPDFEPASKLLERVERAAGAVEVHDLRDASRFDGDATEPSADDLFSELDGLDLDDSLADGAAAAGAGAGGPAAAPSLVGVLEDRLAQRDFAGVLDLAKGAESYPQIAQLVEVARARQEAVPYIQRFLESARAAAGQGDLAGARAHLEKASALDPTHPGVVELQQQVPSAPSALPDIDARSEPIPDAFSTPPGVASPQDEFDAASAASAASASAEPGDRIGQLLAEGQSAFDAGDYQGAIDSWSRIFLIDVDHAEASQRIEEARRLKAEAERQVEEVYHDALNRQEAGDLAGARAGLERVLELQPGHLAAREQLDGLSGGTEAAEPSAPSAMASGPPPAAPSSPPESRLDAPLAPVGEGSGTAWDLKQPILVPPEPGAAPAAEAEPPQTRSGASSGQRLSKRFLLIGSLVLLVALAAVAFFYLNRDRFFPNAQPAEVVAGGDPVAQATALHEKGQTDLALNLLRGVPDGTPRYEEAQALISQWEAEAEPDEEAEAEPEGPSEEDLLNREQLLVAGREAYAQGRYLEAQTLFDEAAAVQPLVEPDLTLRQETEEVLAPLGPYIRMFQEGEYEYALPELWRLREDKPDDVVINRLIVDSYYNLAVSDLQRNDASAAIEKLEEILDLTPDDRVAARHLKFAETYERRNKDLLYRIYVKYLPRR